MMRRPMGNMRTHIMLKKDQLSHHIQSTMNFRCASQWNEDGTMRANGTDVVNHAHWVRHHKHHTAADCKLSVSSSSNAMGKLSAR